MRRNLSALAASILNGRLLRSACEGPPPGAYVAESHAVRPVRRISETPRLTDDTPTQPHRPPGHGA
jgi:hypothetical protein